MLLLLLLLVLLLLLSPLKGRGAKERDRSAVATLVAQLVVEAEQVRLALHVPEEVTPGGNDLRQVLPAPRQATTHHPRRQGTRVLRPKVLVLHQILDALVGGRRERAQGALHVRARDTKHEQAKAKEAGRKRREEEITGLAGLGASS